MRQVRVGDLVTFVEADRGIDIDAPSGTLTNEMSDRLSRSKTYHPHPGEKGIVVAGPTMSTNGFFKLWQVWVGDSGWWFPEDELAVLEPQ